MAATAYSRPTRRPWLALAALTLPVAGALLLLDVALDPVLLDRMWRTGSTAGLLWILGVAIFCCLLAPAELRMPRPRFEHALNLVAGVLIGICFAIISIVFVDPRLPNLRYASLGLLGFSFAVLGHVPGIWSLWLSLRAAHVRRMQEIAREGPAILEDPAPVGVGLMRWVMAVLWSGVVVVVSVYVAVIAQTRPLDGLALLGAATLLGVVYITVLCAFGWMVYRVRLYARATGDVILLASFGPRLKGRAAPPRTRAAPISPDLKVRLPLWLATGIGLAALSLLALVALDIYVVRGLFAGASTSWALWIFCPFVCFLALIRASVRRYPQRRYRRLLFAAAAFVLAGDTLLLDSLHPVHAIVPAPMLLILSVLFALAGVLTCRALLMTQSTALDGHYRPRPRRGLLFLFVYTVVPLPMLIVLTHVMAYRVLPVPATWAETAFYVALLLMADCLTMDPGYILSASADSPLTPRAS